MSESTLSSGLRRSLFKLGVWTLRVQVGGYRGRTLGAPKGTPDIIGYFPPWHPRALQLWACETKCSHPDNCKCDSCKAQREWQAIHEAKGIVYVKARTQEAALAALGFILPAGPA